MVIVPLGKLVLQEVEACFSNVVIFSNQLLTITRFTLNPIEIT